jgi:hypothetical protein
MNLKAPSKWNSTTLLTALRLKNNPYSTYSSAFLKEKVGSFKRRQTLILVLDARPLVAELAHSTSALRAFQLE